MSVTGTTGESSGPRTVQLNPERAPALIAKWQKLLGKDLDRIEVIYTAGGVSVDLYPLEGFVGHKVDSEGDTVALSVAEFKSAKQEAAKPSAEDSKVALRNKFELRLNKEFPSDGNLGDGSEAAIREFLQTLPFHERRAMLMSNKQFKTAYPNGFGPVPAVAGTSAVVSQQPLTGT